MTEAQYLSWIRSALRSKSLRWPPRNTALELARRPYKGPNKQQKWEYQCAICQQWRKMKEVCVDHHPKPAGSILSVEDIGAFANNLYCEVDNLRVLCKEPCHAVHTLAESMGVSFEEALLQKEVIEICKKPTKEVVAFCSDYGYDAKSLSNEVKRRAAVEAILRSVQ
jgi:hypothetical protein